MIPTEDFAELLLEWYDRAARTLPWRVAPADRLEGRRPDPYQVWLSEIMLQQTTVATVAPYFGRFLARWPSVEALAAAPLDDLLVAWAGLGYYARARNLHACAGVVANRFGGRFPPDEATLRTLPGVGAYTAAAIAAIAFDLPAVVIDGNVERVMARVAAIETPLPEAKAEIRAAAADRAPSRRAGDYAQALMDLGATVCTPRRPDCPSCPLRARCASVGRAPERLPAKRAKPPKPIRRGVVFLALAADSRLLLRRRPEHGLLGGMLGLPGPDWAAEPPSVDERLAARPFEADWRPLDVETRHTFTHFHLVLALEGARLTAPVAAGPGDLWVARADLGSLALPTLFAKALALGLAALDRA